MEESYETFEEEFGPPSADPPPHKPVRQIRRPAPEMYSTRKTKEETLAAPQQPKTGPKILPREPSSPRTTTLHKALSIQNLTQIETPWENVTLNRCLLVAITILVLTSGFHRLHEALRGHGTSQEEDAGLTMRRSGSLRHRHTLQPETSLWEVLFWWLPDLDDEDDEEEEDDDAPVKGRKSKRGAAASRGLRNKPLPDKKLMKLKDGKLKSRGKKLKDEDTKIKKERGRQEKTEEDADEEDNEEVVLIKSNKEEEKRVKKKKSQTG
ncbi:uncharacterized protein ACBR49_011438 isoform 2-T3 [Aulostomus maculatus]